MVTCPIFISGVEFLHLHNTTFLYNQMHNLGEFYITYHFSSSYLLLSSGIFLTLFHIREYKKGKLKLIKI